MRRGFVNAGGRLVHYRRAGRGPALVLLHGSPNSSLALVPLMNALKNAFDCIALDTPGNGGSAPLAAEAPTTADYAAALKETADALGLRRFSLYGFHTGAGIAAEFMARWPERAAAAVLDGLAAWTPEEQKGMLAGYLPPFAPSADGTHLVWLWSRLIDQTLFFPWHRPSAATRMDYDMHAPETLHRMAMEFLRAGDNYRKPYAAAFAGDGAARARAIRTPTLIAAHPLDPIAHHLGRLGAVSAEVEVRKDASLDAAENWRAFKAFLSERKGDGAPAAAPNAGAHCGFAATPKGEVFWRGNLAGNGRPLVLLHDAGGSSDLFAPCLSEIAASRPVIALDLPGHGESDLRGPRSKSVEGFAAIVAQALGALGVAEPDAAGFHLGGQVAVELKRADVAREAAMIGALCYDEGERDRHLAAYAPDLSVRWDGAHLIAAWRFVKLRSLFDPWYDRRRENIHRGAPHLDAAALHRQTVDLLKADNRHIDAYAAQFRWPTAERMTAAGASRIFTAPFDPMSADRRVAALRAALRDPLEATALPVSPKEWGPALAGIGA